MKKGKLSVINLQEYKEQKRERWKHDILLQIAKELDKIHESNYEYAKKRILDDAELIGEVYCIPGMAEKRKAQIK